MANAIEIDTVPDSESLIIPAPAPEGPIHDLDAEIRDLQAENTKLRKIAFEDSRTGLPNAKALFRKLNARDEEKSSALIFLHFDNYDAALSQIGDARESFLLRTVAGRIFDVLNLNATKSNGAIGGIEPFALKPDCFGVFVEHAQDRKSIANMIRALHFEFRSPTRIGSAPVKVTLSGGIVILPEDGNTPELIISRAHMAYEVATKSGRSGFRFYAPQMERMAQSKKDFENELRRAIDNKEFCAFFQPKIDLSTGVVTGTEALARWRNRSGQLVSPGHFIPVAEELGMIDSIGQQILHQACVQTQIWRQMGFELSVAVNISPLQFDRPGLDKEILQTLMDTGLPPEALELEITESLAVSEPEKVMEVLGPLKSIGVKLAIDDFGTGHSNLATLAKLPFDVFKIDRQFISAIGSDQKAPVIVDMMLAMAKALGLSVVAEGVETPAQIIFLKKRRCETAQGFHYSRPLSADDFASYLTEQSPSKLRKRFAS